MKSLNIQAKALIIATVILTVLFTVMINVHGFRNF